MKKIVLSDRGCLFADMILQETDWEIQLLIVDDFGHHKEKYAGNSRIKEIINLSEMMNWRGEFDLDKNEVKKYLNAFNVGDYGSRRIKDDYHFSHFQFYQGVAFWNDYFKNNKVDFCVLTNTIHGFPNDYLLENCAANYGINTYNVFYHFIDKFAVYETKKQELLTLLDEKENCFNIEKIANYRDNFDYNFLKDIPYPKIARIVYKIWGAKGIRYAAFLLRGKHSIHYRDCTFFEYRKSFNYIKKLNSYVKDKYTEVNFNENYIVHFLHFEPEAVVTANSQIIDSQLVQIKMLSDSLPDGWKIYVKEHPDTYENINSWALEYHIPVMPTFYTKYFYDTLLSFKNVRLVNYKVSAGDLIKHCKAASTIAGTVMTEAINNGKPVLMFSDNRHIYCKSKGVFSISSLSDLKNAIANIGDGYSPNYDDIEDLCAMYLAETDDAGIVRILESIIKNEE